MPSLKSAWLRLGKSAAWTSSNGTPKSPADLRQFLLRLQRVVGVAIKQHLSKLGLIRHGHNGKGRAIPGQCITHGSETGFGIGPCPVLPRSGKGKSSSPTGTATG